MKPILKETVREVKRKIPGQSKKADPVRRYSRRSARLAATELDHRTQDECLRVLQKVGSYQMFPGSSLTNIYEAGAFFQVDADQIRKDAWIVSRFAPAEFPVMRVREFVESMSTVPDCKCAILENYLYVGHGEVAMKTGYVPNNCMFRTLTPKGMIIMAYNLANGLSEDNRRIAKLVVDECERSGIFEKEAPPVKSEPIPADPAPEPTKLDPAQTLTQMFNAMLTLLMKESEERGAEKIIQQLKEAGKL